MARQGQEAAKTGKMPSQGSQITLRQGKALLHEQLEGHNHKGRYPTGHGRSAPRSAIDRNQTSLLV